MLWLGARKRQFEDDARTGRQQTFRTERKIQEVATLVSANRSQSVEDLAAAVRVSHGTCYQILTNDLNIFRVIQHTVSRILSHDQRDVRICGDLISSAVDDPTFYRGIVTGDETSLELIYLYFPPSFHLTVVDSILQHPQGLL